MNELGVKMCLLTVLAKYDQSLVAKSVKMAKSCDISKHVHIYEILNTHLNRGRLGVFSCFTNAFLFHQTIRTSVVGKM